MTLPADKMPLRVKILNAVVAAIKEVTPDFGFHNTLGPDEHGRDRVVRGRIAIGNDEPLPFVTVIEPPLASRTSSGAPLLAVAVLMGVVRPVEMTCSA